MSKLIAAIEALPDDRRVLTATEREVTQFTLSQLCMTDDLKALANQLKWIPVSERLPELTRFYLVTYKNGKHPNAVMELRFNPSYGWASPDDEKLNVVAWRPLPEPYTAERGEE